MKLQRLAILATLTLIVLTVASGQNPNPSTQDTGSATAQTPQAGATNTAAGTVVESPALRVLSPKDGQQITQSYVNVRFEVKNPNQASNFPNFRVQLDGQDPVRTTSPEYTFTGLAPGHHVIVVEQVDANQTPIQGSRTQVKFTVVQQPAQGSQPKGGAAALEAPAQVAQASLIPEAQNTPNRNSNHDGLPTSGSSLPLLSVIGFGVLLGGIASALKTR
jgi:hypothetical protein